MSEVNITNNSDVGITCICGCTFTAKGIFSKEVAEMFIRHHEAAHKILEKTDDK